MMDMKMLSKVIRVYSGLMSTEDWNSATIAGLARCVSETSMRDVLPQSVNFALDGLAIAYHSMDFEDWERQNIIKALDHLFGRAKQLVRKHGSRGLKAIDIAGFREAVRLLPGLRSDHIDYLSKIL